MKPILTHPSWYDIEKGCAKIAMNVLSDRERGKQLPQVIVGLARGGLIPAVIISHILEIPMTPISYSSKEGRGEFKAYDNILPDIDARSILFVDDIVDSGATLSEVASFYIEKKYIVRTAAIYYKQGAMIKPTYNWQEIPENSPWIIFPYEA